jgi:hypothetical protein
MLRYRSSVVVYVEYARSALVGHPAAVAALGLGTWLYGSGRKMRDPRLDRDYSDDEAAPYDGPASLNPQMDQYMRIVNDDDRPKY